MRYYYMLCRAVEAEGEGGCSSHTEGCDGSTGTIFLPAAVETLRFM